MTVPLTPGLSSPATSTSGVPSLPLVWAAPAGPVDFPLGWLLQHGAPPLQYRAVTDVARLTLPPPDAGRFAILPLGFSPALRLALIQQLDGTWGASMLGVPSARSHAFEGVGTISAVRRLLEYGWDRDTPPLVRARRILFRLLAEDEDPAYLYELGGRSKVDPGTASRGRMLLREAAAATLAQAGYESDPRLRGAARRIIERVSIYLRSPLSQRPFVRVGNHQVLAPEAAPPSIHNLVMLAHMPLFRSEHYETTDRIYQHIAQPLPRQTAAMVIANRVVALPHLVLGDPLPHRNAVDADVPWALIWLELMARLQFLRRNEGWSKLFERFLDDRDAEGVWHPHKGMAMPKTINPLVWPSFPLEHQLAGDERWSDVTFRLGLIARHAGRQINLK